MKRLIAALSLLTTCHVFASDASDTTVYMDWDSHYVSEGRNNLPQGGIFWSGIDHTDGAWLWYERQGIGDSTNFIELNMGFMYQFELPNDFSLATGYKRLEFFGDDRCSDNELAAELSYNAIAWLTPNLAYTYATEAHGAFVEFSLTGHWQPFTDLTISPYILQGWDLGFASLHHDGRNNFQFGVEAAYELSSQVNLALQISHSIGQGDIERQEQEEDCIDELNQTFAGIQLSYRF